MNDFRQCTMQLPAFARNEIGRVLLHAARPQPCSVKEQSMATKSIPVGTVFGRLTVVGIGVVNASANGDRKATSVVRCECGTTKTVNNGSLKTGNTESCGCASMQNKTRHGLSRTPEYWALQAIIQRCTNPKTKHYSSYGGRGITVCETWMKFENFVADMGFRPTPQHSIDRTNNELGYCKENCRWVLRIEQANNTRRNVNLTFYGKTMTVSEWSRISQVIPVTIHSRLRNGWSEKEAVWTPVKKTTV